MSRNDEQRDLAQSTPELAPNLDAKVSCRLKPDRRRPSATLDHWAAAFKDFRRSNATSDSL